MQLARKPTRPRDAYSWHRSFTFPSSLSYWLLISADMDVGTAETLDEIPQSKPRGLRTTFGGPGTSSGGGGRRNPGGGSDGPDDDDGAQVPQAFVPEKSRILTAFLLV